MQLLDVPFVAGRLARRLVPDGLSRRHDETENLRDLLEVHDWQLQAVERMVAIPFGETVLDLNPGRYNPAAAGFLGAEAGELIFLEPSRHDLDVQYLSQRLADFFSAMGFAGSVWEKASQPDHQAGATETTFGGGRLRFRWEDIIHCTLPKASVGLLFSHLVLQSLPQPEAAVAQLAQLLKPGACMAHRVDLRDHFLQSPLQFLCYSDYVWEKILTSRYPHKGYLNRLRLPEWVDLFQAYGLEVETQVITRDIESVRRLRPHLDDHFLQFSNEELSPLIANIYCYKS